MLPGRSRILGTHTKTAASGAAASSGSDLVRKSSGGFLRSVLHSVRGFVGFRRHLAGQFFTGLGRKLGGFGAEFLRDTTEGLGCAHEQVCLLLHEVAIRLAVIGLL